MYNKKSRKRRPTAEEIEAIMAFYGAEKPRSMYDETLPFPRARKPKITVTQIEITF